MTGLFFAAAATFATEPRDCNAATLPMAKRAGKFLPLPGRRSWRQQHRPHWDDGTPGRGDLAGRQRRGIGPRYLSVLRQQAGAGAEGTGKTSSLRGVGLAENRSGWQVAPV